MEHFHEVLVYQPFVKVCDACMLYAFFIRMISTRFVEQLQEFIVLCNTSFVCSLFDENIPADVLVRLAYAFLDMYDK